MRQKNRFRMLLLLVLILNVVAISIRTKPAYAQPLIYMFQVPEPPLEPGSTFEVWLLISGVPSPGAAVWQLKLKFNSEVLNVLDPETDIVEGDWLSRGGSLATYFTAIKPAAYYLTISCFLIEAGSTTGDGWLATVTFTVVGPGESVLDLFDTELVQEDGVTKIPHEANDGTFYTDTPKADFTYEHTNSTLRSPVVDETITFNASKSYDGDRNYGGEITSYKWDFDDGTIETYVKDVNLTDTTTHSYAQRGDYTVILTVADNSDPPLTNSKSLEVHVAQRDIAVTDLEITPAAATPGTIVNINVTITNVGYEPEWFNVSLYYDDTPIWYNPAEVQKDFCLPLEDGPDGRPPAPALLRTDDPLEIAFKWNTTDLPEQSYTIRANASIVVSTGIFNEIFEDVEIDYTNNAKQGNAVVTSAPRNVAVTDVTVSPTVIEVGPGPIAINVTVGNEAIGYDETISVSVFYGSSNLIENRTESLPANATTTLEFIWDTTGIPNGTYIITANASLAPEIRTYADQTATNGSVTNPDNAIDMDTATYASFNITETNYPNPSWFEVKNFNATAPTTPTSFFLDVIMRYNVTLSNAMYRILLCVGSKNTTLHDWGVTPSPFPDFKVWNNVQEPNDVLWNWTDLTNMRIRVEVNKTAPGGSGEFRWYESWGSIPGEDALGLTGDNSRTYDGTIIISYAPTANFTYSPDAPKVWDAVSFDASDSTDPDGTIQNYVWDFGDESPPSSGKTASHTYIHAQTYNVNLTVTDNATLTNTLVKQIVIDKASSTISISVSEATITYGDSVTINGSITPIRPQVDVTLLFKAQEEQTWSNFSIQKTNETGHYIYTWTPPAAKTYDVMARWLGDADTTANVSTPLSITVNKAPSVITALASPISVSVGSNITITGTITPAQTGVTVTIQVRTPGEAESTLDTAVTDASGSYSYTWTPTEEGTFEIRAVWDGDDNTIGDQSEWETVEVKEAPPPTPTVYYIAAAIAVAAILIVIAVYFLKIRK